MERESGLMVRVKEATDGDDYHVDHESSMM